MVHQHYGTQTVNRGAVMPGMLVKHKDGTEHARQIDSILNPSVPNLSQSKNKEGTNDV